MQNPHRSDWKVQTLFISTNYGPVSSFLYAPKSNKRFLQSSLLPFFHWHVFFRVRHGGRYLYQTLNSTKRHCQLNQLQILSTKCKVSLPLRGRWKRPQDVKLIFFSEGHLAPKFFKVVANSKEVGRHFQRQTNPFFYAVIVLEIKLGKRSLTCYKVDTRMDDIQRSSSPKSRMASSHRSRCMCCVLEPNLTRKFAADLSLQIISILHIS